MKSKSIYFFFAMTFFLKCHAHNCNDMAHLMSEKFSDISFNEIENQRKFLSKIEHLDDVKDNHEGTSVFIGNVIKRKNVNDNRDAKVTVRIERIIYGIPQKTKYIDIYTPLFNNGVNFKIGEHYKIAAINLQECYWTWTWTGTYSVPIKEID